MQIYASGIAKPRALEVEMKKLSLVLRVHIKPVGSEPGSAGRSPKPTWRLVGRPLRAGGTLIDVDAPFPDEGKG